MFLADEMGRLADSFLSLVERDRDAPYYTEPGFRRRLELDRRRQSKLAEPPPRVELSYLLRHEWSEMVQMANLTARQREVFAKRLSGWTFEEIGNASGRTRQGAQRVFSQAVRKLMVAWNEYPYRGLADVYRQEVSRRGGKLRT
ncbi:MAG: hypothetical protein K1X67_25545 [Fimbriimonadaceae bacterium]|nr:hypothetical protein [Fimbriimonadaceae bacterium]